MGRREAGLEDEDVRALLSALGRVASIGRREMREFGDVLQPHVAAANITERHLTAVWQIFLHEPLTVGARARDRPARDAHVREVERARRAEGEPDDRLDRPRVVARLGGPVRSPAGKVSFLRVRLSVGDEGLAAGLTGNQGSGVLSSCVAADGLAVVPAEHRELPEGSPVQVVLLREDLAWVS